MPDQGKSLIARVVAVGGLIIASVLVIAVIASSGGGSSSNTGASGGSGTSGAQTNDPHVRKALATGYYVVQQGDTVDSIATATGVSSATLQQLNPTIDPQLLATGAKLKLRAK